MFSISLTLDRKYNNITQDPFPVSAYGDNLNIKASNYYINMSWFVKTEEGKVSKDRTFLLSSEYYMFITDLENALSTRDQLGKFYKVEKDVGAVPLVQYIINKNFMDFNLKISLVTVQDTNDNLLKPYGVEIFGEKVINIGGGYNSETTVTLFSTKMSYIELSTNIMMMKGVDIPNVVLNSMVLNSIYGKIRYGKSTEEVDPNTVFGHHNHKENVYNMKPQKQKLCPFGKVDNINKQELKEKNATVCNIPDESKSALASFEKYK